MMDSGGAEADSLDDFRTRVREFLRAEIGPPGDSAPLTLRNTGGDDAEDLREVARQRELQRRFFDAGLAGIAVPVEYGGQGLTPAHQRVMNEEIVGYDFAGRLQVPNMTPCMAVILDFGTEEQKREHILPILRGERLWMQFLSEPGAGSDVAGALTTAVRDGEEWVLNGSKVWTTGAWWADWGLCLARTNWDVPKHRGLTVFMFPIDAEGIEVHRIEMLNGNMDFCQEFLSDVRVPDEQRLGDVDDGWTVGLRWMFHERMGANSPYVTLPADFEHTALDGAAVLSVVAEAGAIDDPVAQDRIGEAETLHLVGQALTRRVGDAMQRGTMSDQASALVRMFVGLSLARRNTLTFELAGVDGIAWTADDGPIAFRGDDFLMRQAACIGGGTIEMAANVVSERVLGMPREPSLDRDRPFRDVPRGPR